MKTYSGANVTKKHIVSVLRTMDATAIFRLYHTIYGGKVTRSKVFDFIQEYAPSRKIERAAFEIAFNRKNVDKHCMCCGTINEPIHKVVDYLRYNLTMLHSPYAKRPMMGHTHLYFCSPVYKHSDYNKWRAMPIAGNEEFCRKVIAVADKYFTPIYGE